MKIAALAFTAALATTASAEVWEGKGKIFGLHREHLADYTLKVRIGAESASGIKETVTVYNSDGNVIHSDSCVRRSHGPGWKKECDGGKSRGHALDFGLAVDYYEAKDGKNYATDIVVDGKDKIRLIRTELVGGKAMKFFVETLTKREE